MRSFSDSDSDFDYGSDNDVPSSPPELRRSFAEDGDTTQTYLYKNEQGKLGVIQGSFDLNDKSNRDLTPVLLSSHFFSRRPSLTCRDEARIYCDPDASLDPDSDRDFGPSSQAISI